MTFRTVIVELLTTQGEMRLRDIHAFFAGRFNGRAAEFCITALDAMVEDGSLLRRCDDGCTYYKLKEARDAT